MPNPPDAIDFTALAELIKTRGLQLGFQQIGITDTDVAEHEQHLHNWLADNMHGEMDYMSRHGLKRSRPAQLIPGTQRVISARMDYWPEPSADAETQLQDPIAAYLSRYALGRDYHKVLRKRLQRLADYMTSLIGEHSYRVFVDSAPVLEKALAEKAGLGWIGKHTNLINDKQGSWFFLGEIYTDLPLPLDKKAENHCGTCSSCIDVCPTNAIIAPYQLDARRCISYLTIELRDSIPVELRQGIGNRIYGCDDCQLACPWNRFARPSAETDFAPRHGLDTADLITLFEWDEDTFHIRTEGSAIRRIGYHCWLRNIAVALGNAPSTPAVIAALNKRLSDASELVREHVIWALHQHGNDQV